MSEPVSRPSRADTTEGRTEAREASSCPGCNACKAQPCIGGCKVCRPYDGDPFHVCADEYACAAAYVAHHRPRRPYLREETDHA